MIFLEYFQIFPQFPRDKNTVYTKADRPNKLFQAKKTGAEKYISSPDFHDYFWTITFSISNSNSQTRKVMLRIVASLLIVHDFSHLFRKTHLFLLPKNPATPLSRPRRWGFPRWSFPRPRSDARSDPPPRRGRGRRSQHGGCGAAPGATAPGKSWDDEGGTGCWRGYMYSIQYVFIYIYISYIKHWHATTSARLQRSIDCEAALSHRFEIQDLIKDAAVAPCND